MISVIIVTYNRRQLLKECIESILRQETVEIVEIVVIDNSSNDGTQGFIREYFADKIKFVRNTARMSLWEAKNSGIRAAQGNIIAFIDDDCIASEHWLGEIGKTLHGFDFAGGATLAMPDTRFPWWWRKSLEWLTGINTAPNRKFLPLGNNAAFHKYVLEKILIDNKNFIPREYLPYGEDNYRLQQALSHNFTLKINKNLIIYHRIPRERLTLSYLIKRSCQEGKATASYKKEITALLFSFIALPYNFILLLCSLDINRIFRIISNLAYILYYLKNKLAGLSPI